MFTNGLAQKIILMAQTQAKELDIKDCQDNNQIPHSVWNDFAKKNNLSEVAEGTTVDFNMAKDLIEKNLATKYGVTANELNQAKEAKNFGVNNENSKNTASDE